MGDFRRHVVAGDKLSVLFRYHKGHADLEVSCIDIKKALRGAGTLADDGNFAVESANVPELEDGNALYVRGTDSSSDHDVSEYIYESEEERDEALVAFCTLIAEFNGFAAQDWIPESLGGTPRADGNGFVIAKSKSGGDSMFKTVKNTLASNLLDAKLVVEVPGLGAGDVRVARPAGKKQILVVYKVDGKEIDPMVYTLADAEVAGVTANVDKGIFTLDVKYDLGTSITVTDGAVAVAE